MLPIIVIAWRLEAEKLALVFGFDLDLLIIQKLRPIDPWIAIASHRNKSFQM
jgi:hypothetical protein